MLFWAPSLLIFLGVAQIFRDFVKVFRDFAQIFTKSKLLGVRLHPLHHRLLHQWRRQRVYLSFF